MTYTVSIIMKKSET